MSYYYHEQLYRGEDVMKKLAKCRITVCGAGALGANLAESLARSGARTLVLIDRDRIEERNLSTQPYEQADVGGFKAKILAGSLFRSVGVKAEAKTTELTGSNAEKLLSGAELVVDTFDNSVARAAVKEACERSGQKALHAGMASEYAEVIWNEDYKVPGSGQDDICDYPLARSLSMLTVAITCEVIIRWLSTGRQESYSLTLGDFGVRTYPP